MTDNLDPLRTIEGFPLGKDKDLQALSNPPYYTAYPNPHIADFIKEYGKPYDEATDDYHREPFVSDVSEGKNDPIYNAHSYHTKVPYKAIIPFIEHYTEPGDIVFDGFCGTGMTGVAAQSISRRAILCDLSPAATFIASNYNLHLDVDKFEKEARRILLEVEQECRWMYETRHTNNERGIINFTLWSDEFICPYCNHKLNFWDVAVDLEHQKVLGTFLCPHCKAEIRKSDLSHSYISYFDKDIAENISQIVRQPVEINYTVNRKRFTRPLSQDDMKLLLQIDKQEIPYWFPTVRMPEGDEARRNDPFGMTHVHHFFHKRELWVLSALWDKINKLADTRTKLALLIPFTTMLAYCSFMRRFRPDKKGGGPLSGTLYVSSLSTPLNPLVSYRNNLDGAIEAFRLIAKFHNDSCVSTQSTTSLKNIQSNSINYIFTDPPFGDNLMYSELNFLWEAWLKVVANNIREAIINKTQKKEINEYRELMTNAFDEMYRVLKPGRWITVEFHNSKASVWNAIQDALMRAGFVVAQVTVLDKQQGSFKQVTSAGAVKNDLVINAYKPRSGFTQRLISQAGRGLEADFVREHLRQLPVAANVERSKEMLYSKYLAYYVQHGYQVAYNGEQFYRALSQWGLEERDNYWFADEAQAQGYEQRKIKTFGKKGVQPQAVLFISDERSARQWIWNFLDEPKTITEIYTKFVQALQTSEDEIPELLTMLEESFIRTNGHWKRPDQLTQVELEQKRLERLLRQFNEYLDAAQAGQKVKEVRREAVLAGFTECYRAGRFDDIVLLGQKLDKRLLEESPDLFDFVDIAKAKIE